MRDDNEISRAEEGHQEITNATNLDKVLMIEEDIRKKMYWAGFDVTNFLYSRYTHLGELSIASIMAKVTTSLVDIEIETRESANGVAKACARGGITAFAFVEN